MTTGITNLAANKDALGTLSSFLSTKEKSELRATNRTFSEEIPDLPGEAKTFLAFEAKLPLIREIIRMTGICRQYRDYQLEIPPPTLAKFLLTYTLRAEEPYSIWETFATTFVSSFILTPKPEQPADAMIFFERLIFLSGIAIVTSYALPRLIAYVTGNMDPSVQLRGLWNELRNENIPGNLLASGDQLAARLADHQRLATEYQRAGGMDRYYALRGYTSGGLDQAFHEARSASPRRVIIAGEALTSGALLPQ